jgi:multicomponent Na+:H+ antiporter subunit G
MSSLLGLIIMGVGLAFDLIGCVGLVRLPDPYHRLQASTKCVTLGTCMILFGTFVYVGFNAAGMKALLCMMFVLFTAPTAAHALARGTHRSGVKLAGSHAVDKYAEDSEGEK